jgi:8-oxo-dGTP diphosphatase
MIRTQLATLCYVKHRGRTLLLHRIKKKRDVHEGKWNGLGGKCEAGESPDRCVVREIKEESGLSIRSPKLKGVILFPSFTPNTDWLVFLYVAKRFRGKLIDSNEGQLAWIPDRKIPSLNMWKGDRIFLKWLNGRRFFSATFVYKNKKFIRHHVVFH